MGYSSFLVSLRQCDHIRCCLYLQPRHYSGHGTKVPDLNGDEDDGYDEALVPLDFDRSGVILDDDLYEIFVKGLPPGVHVVALMDCCHSGTVLDLPYIFKADGNFSQMEIDRGSLSASKLFGQLGGMLKMVMGGSNGNGGGSGKLVEGFIKQFLR